MPYGSNGRILRVNLTDRKVIIEEPSENFYRTYLGGWGFISHYLFKELAPGLDPFGPENKLVFADGVISGAPIGGASRNSVGAKSPLTGALGEAEVGGFWGAELKFAGYDALIVEGKAERPVYLWIHDSEVKIREAHHLWGLTTGACQQAIRDELGDQFIRVAQIGPAGENLVRYACVINDLKDAAGRTGMGAVMGSKNLKAIAVRGHKRPALADPEKVQSLAKWLAKSYKDLARELHEAGTGTSLVGLGLSGGLPTRNFREGNFEGAEKISALAIRDQVRLRMDGCYACPIRCKKVVKIEEPYTVDPMYGGPEYETLAAFGSNCGVDDLKAICKANEICGAYSLDTISTGNVIGFAMECFENGLLTERDTAGLRLTFGNAEAMVSLVQLIARRESIGDLLAEGVQRAAQSIGPGAEKLAMHVKGQGLPMHEPRLKHGLGIGYAISPTGADHCHSMHDTLYAQEGSNLQSLKPLGILEPLPADDLSPAKVRMFVYEHQRRALCNCLLLCIFLPYSSQQVVDLVNGVTGWETSVWELMKVSERTLNLARAFNAREGFDARDDGLPDRIYEPFRSGPLAGHGIDREAMREALRTYYQMMGWDATSGWPTAAKLHELGLGWVAKALEQYRQMSRQVSRAALV
ncbi:MAG: aldehyde ferredoxin oxidoreductase family protein [Chloroflexi bacterium]|nr:aldehyde ferredoxin oxidoreductase family protein [Chloroflexota bacterium]